MPLLAVLLGAPPSSTTKAVIAVAPPTSAPAISGPGIEHPYSLRQAGRGVLGLGVEAFGPPPGCCLS